MSCDDLFMMGIILFLSVCSYEAGSVNGYWKAKSEAKAKEGK